MINIETSDRRCLILGCTRRKIESADLIPAIDRYDGPSFRVLRKFLRVAPVDLKNVDVFVLSAKYGLINGEQKIGMYDELMTSSRAKLIKDEAERKLFDIFRLHQYRSVFLSMSKTYLKAIEDIDIVVGNQTQMVISQTGSGRKLTELKNWLWDETRERTPQAEENIEVQISLFPQLVMLRGRQVELTTEQAYQIIAKGYHRDSESARKVRNWYLEYDGNRLSPKWAAKEIFELPVSGFSADEARRALRKLGIKCYRS